nr:hypothetical protein BaRGS_015063 [Batillaria attramentaria]
MTDMTDTLSAMVEEDRFQSVEQEMTAAEDIVASLGNILTAATEGVGVDDLVFDAGSSDSAEFVSTTPVNESLVEPDYSEYYEDPDVSASRNESLPPYTVSFYTSTCRYWDETLELWSTAGCQVTRESTAAVTRCLCNHLTSFGAGVFVAPNQIHFDTVFNDLGAKIADNYAVIITLGVVYFFYIIGMIWARRMDRKDVEKWGATPLADNLATDKYFYRMTVFTGMRTGAGTRSNVSFVLSGDHTDTGVRRLADEGGKKTLSRGTVNQYVLGVPACLGPLSYLRIWHDNTGKGKHQGWYLGKIIVTDLQNGASYIFLCNRWLAVEEDDGNVDRILPVAGREDLIDFQHLFFTEAQRSLSDSHLWVSVFSRPRRSTFSRVQRLSCILCLLLATMMADAMFYQTGGENGDSQSGSVEVGPVKLTMQELYVSFISSLIILPLNLVIDQLFRRSRPKTHKVDAGFLQSSSRPPTRAGSASHGSVRAGKSPGVSDIFVVDGGETRKNEPKATEDCDGEDGKDNDADSCESGKKNNKNNTTRKAANNRPADEVQDTENSDKKEEKTDRSGEKSVKPKRGKLLLPHWCVYVAWALVLFVSGVSTFITFSYSMEWGRDKSIAWLSAMLLSVGQSVMLVQPVKIVVLALVMAWVCKKPQEEEEEKEEEAALDTSQIHLQPDEEPLDYTPRLACRPQLSAPAQDSEALTSCRERRMKEVAMQRVTREVVAYILYLLLLVLVAVHNRDPRGFLWTSSVRNLLNAGPTVDQVRTGRDVWNWTQRVVIPNLYPDTDYRGQPLPDGGGRIVSTMAAYRVGPVRLRQHRVTSVSCRIPAPFSDDTTFCTQTWSWSAQDTATYREGWTTPAENYSPGVNDPWVYSDWMNTDGIPHAGAIGVYPAGGYVKDLIGTRQRVEQLVSELENLEWIDKYTRAVFVEFVLYNPNVNLFAMVTVVFETPMTGTLKGEVIVASFRLFSYLGSYGVFVAFVEAMVVICTVYFVCREAKKVWKQRKKYFGQFWNWVELATLLGSLTSIVMYVGRHVLTVAAVNKIKSLRGKYYNFQRLSLWDELFGYVLAFVTFLAILKTAHLLRFNRRVSMLGSTLMRAAKDLSSFAIVFVIVFIAFFSCGCVLFGSQLPDYINIVTAIETLFSVCLGQAQFQVLEDANRVLGPAFFFCYMMFVVFVLLNMFLTILNETFTAVRQDISLQSNDYEIVDFMWKTIRNWFGTNRFPIAKNRKGQYSKNKKRNGSDPAEGRGTDLAEHDHLSPLSVINLMLRHLEDDFDHLGERRNGPYSSDTLDHSPFRLHPGYSHRDALDGVKFSECGDIVISDDEDLDDY